MGFLEKTDGLFGWEDGYKGHPSCTYTNAFFMATSIGDWDTYGDTFGAAGVHSIIGALNSLQAQITAEDLWDRGGTILSPATSGDTLQVGSGDTTNPGYAFESDPDVGMYLGTDALGNPATSFSVGDSLGATFSSAGLQVNVVGSAANPAISWSTDADTGLYRGTDAGANDLIGISTAGTARVLISSQDGFVVQNVGAISATASGASNITVTGATADLTLGARASSITLNESGDTALDAGFTASSIIGALNELHEGFSPVVTGTISASASNEVEDSFSTSSDNWCEWTYYIQYDTNLRAGNILAVWDASAGTVSYSETATTDIGDTTDITFDVNYSGGTLALRASNAGSNVYNYGLLRKTTDAGGGILLTSRNEKLQRIDTSAWEDAQTGVEYYSPDQQGGFFGTVVRQYWNISGVSGDPTLIASGISQLVAAGGNAYNSSTGNSILVASYKGGSSVVTPRLQADALVLERFGDFDDTGDTADVWCDYIKT